MLLSIIIPVYNVEKYIRKTLESIYSQSFTYDDVEVIVVNDGTPDNSMQIVEEFATLHKNLHIINQQNKGLSGARNTGMQAAKGKYVWFVDSDDWIEEGCLSLILDRLTKAYEDVFVFRLKMFDEEGRILNVRRFNKDIEYTINGIDALLEPKFDHVPMQIYIINSSFYSSKNLKFVEGLQHEDVEFSAKMLMNARYVVFSPIVSYCYLRRTSGSITSGKYMSKKRINSYFYILNEFAEIEKNSCNFKIKRAFAQYQRDYILQLYYLVSRDDMYNEGLLDYNFLKKNKKIVRSCIKYREDLKHVIKDLLFLISVNLYNKYMTLKYIK